MSLLLDKEQGVPSVSWAYVPEHWDDGQSWAVLFPAVLLDPPSCCGSHPQALSSCLSGAAEEPKLPSLSPSLSFNHKLILLMPCPGPSVSLSSDLPDTNISSFCLNYIGQLIELTLNFQFSGTHVLTPSVSPCTHFVLLMPYLGLLGVGWHRRPSALRHQGQGWLCGMIAANPAQCLCYAVCRSHKRVYSGHLHKGKDRTGSGGCR